MHSCEMKIGPAISKLCHYFLVDFMVFSRRSGKYLICFTFATFPKFIECTYKIIVRWTMFDYEYIIVQLEYSNYHQKILSFFFFSNKFLYNYDISVLNL